MKDIFSNLNYIAIIVATIAAFLLGWLWYADKIFGLKWRTALGKKNEDFTDCRKAMVWTFVTILASASMLEIFIDAFGIITYIDGALLGLLISSGFIATTMLSNYLFLNLPLKAWCIDAGYRVTIFVLMGAILGGWR